MHEFHKFIQNIRIEFFLVCCWLYVLCVIIIIYFIYVVTVKYVIECLNSSDIVKRGVY